MTETSHAPDDHRRSIPILPTIFTLLNLFLGWLAIVRAFDGRPAQGALFVILAAVLDKLDGYVARAMDTSSEFGRELDSLADVVSFGVAPAMIAISWGLAPLHRVGAAAAFVFTACGALRLARFNILPPATDKRWFVGLPIPMAAAVPMTLIVAQAFAIGDWREKLDDVSLAWGFALLMVACAVLMVSNIRYFAFKESRVSRRWRHVLVLGFVAVLAAILAVPEITLPVLAIGFALHGPVLRVAGMLGWRPAGAVPHGRPDQSK